MPTNAIHKINKQVMVNVLDWYKNVMVFVTVPIILMRKTVVSRFRSQTGDFNLEKCKRIFLNIGWLWDEKYFLLNKKYRKISNLSLKLAMKWWNLIDNSNMTSFKCLESKPVVKIIFIYDF
jgi:hypothetical protein